ncbi:putative ABC transport system permease protein [Dysgonomonas sp. PFB1-18]|uniref:ABC transporter permease n=1 Tax=unclassified Dysgonomonas TaxID=2630389 RepID=UPI00247367AF|nr:MULTISPECIES: ABC transporter permease [unclassified Dysgonomonas]MDH6308563.1 putative ABC transport system permease protein [Dysgonomonas sp. PF1-14]MDH6338064.1 putative ABC transport system permease protein [Dysgonomonas sp. PF1-16]MDH6379561.1 putative ABC transport system permease protein [Dysgonomonas sp. PFB1-18]MDH6396891.1 putative ABC transport system permease protein [Dysgonomonas sp. PF1-23]
MFDLDNWKEIWITITRNKLRSILTAFGVFWGIFMLVILIGIGNAFKGGMMQVVDGFAPNSCFFYTELTSEAYKGYRKGRYWNMNNKDLLLIREKAQSVEHISPMLFLWRSDKNIVRGEKTGTYGIKGVYPENFIIENPRIMYGRVINDVDIKNNRKVCVIGKEIYETLFNVGDDPIGQYIRVRGIYFQVIGVISSTAQISIGGRPETTVHLPFSTMQKTYNKGDVIDFLGCTAKPGYPAKVVEEEVKSIVKNAHDISPDDDKAMGSFNAEQIFQAFQALFFGVDFLVFFVGMGALLSGIIGISNIMLVTVKERTREIGVRRALGAGPVTIVKQVLSESLLLTSIAGLIGFLFGVALLEFVDYMMENGVLEIKLFVPPFISFSTAIKALIVLVISGVLAGLMPAMRALRIKAIDAIRDE